MAPVIVTTKMRNVPVLLLLASASAFAQGVDKTAALLWYDKPATDWEKQALPIGNGRMGAMIFGGIDAERLQISEKSLWTGGPGSEGGYDYGLPKESQAPLMRKIGKQLVDGATLALGGTSAPWGPRLLTEHAPDADFRIVLSHSPDQLPNARKWGMDFVLSGHNHGGQIRLPLLVRRFQRFDLKPLLRELRFCFGHRDTKRRVIKLEQRIALVDELIVHDRDFNYLA